MGKPIEPIIFYVPYLRDGLADVPASDAEYWPWLLRHRGINEGKYSWTLQTYLQLRAGGFDCTLSATFPSRGIVVSHRDFLPVFLRPRPDVFLVCIKPDRNEHTWAHYYLVQNTRDQILRESKGRGRASVLPFWPQPGLVSRNPDRGATCRNVVYLGRDGNLASELKTPAWESELSALGFAWQRRSMAQWHDYSDIDVTVAARSFEKIATAVDSVYDVDSKPPSKLVNSWLAGVPAVLGAESAYRHVRESELDYLEATTPDELKAALQRLSGDAALYSAMVEHGRKRAAAFSVEATRGRWREILLSEMRPRLEEWRARSGATRAAGEFVETLTYFTRAKNLRGLLTIFK